MGGNGQATASSQVETFPVWRALCRLTAFTTMGGKSYPDPRDIAVWWLLALQKYLAFAAPIRLVRVAFTWVHATRSTSLFFEHLHTFR
jgi:hypothetical protein